MDAVSLDVATVAQGQRFRSSIFLAGFVVLLYDHLMTLPSEVKYIWARPTKRSSAWFLFVRYPALLCNLSMTAVIFGNFSPEICKRFSAFESYLLVVQEFFVGCTLAIRVCAMYGFNRRVFVSLSIAAIVTVSVAAWSVVGSGGTVETVLPGCHVTTPRTRAIHLAVAWESLLVGDMLILGLTLRRACAYDRSAGLDWGSMLLVMARDGVVYFGIICAVNLANIVILYCGDIIIAASLSSFAAAISVTMVSRLMLNLHDAAMGGSGDSITGQDPDPMRFQWPTEIGTVGATA